MKLKLKYILPLAVAAAALTWLSFQEGHVSVQLGANTVEMSPLALAILILLTLWLAIRLDRLRGWVRSMPTRWRQHQRIKHDTQGIRAIVDGFSSLAAGDTDQANSYIHKATQLLGNSQQPVQPLIHMLHAQIASQDGDSPTALNHYHAMLESKESRFLGLRGLLMHHRRQIRATPEPSTAQMNEAIELAEQALEECSSALWVSQLLAEWYCRTHAWPAYHAMVGKALKAHAISKTESKHWRAIGYSAEAVAARDAAQRQQLALKALKASPSFLPAQLLLLDGLQKARDSKATIKYVTRFWNMQPHPFMLTSLRQALKGQPADRQLKTIEKATEGQPSHLLTYIAIAEMSIEAKQWSKGRNHLKSAWTSTPSQPIAKLFITLEEQAARSENTEITDLTLWRERLEEAPSLPQWHCQSCGHETQKWYALCPSCGEYDQLYWPNLSQSTALTKS